MVNNQKWFDSNFPKEEKRINIKYEEFQGNLLVENYPNLERLYLLRIDKINSITLKNLNQLKECTIWECGLTDLVIESCTQIKKANVRNNFLTSLGFLKNLEESQELDLDISCNNFSKNNLESFGRISNLHALNIGNSLRRKFLQGKYNHFFGSLKPLENTSKLRELDISNTNIDRGLEYLPESMKKIFCSSDRIISWVKENKCSKIIQKLKDYHVSSNCYDLDLWRNNQPFYGIASRLATETIQENRDAFINQGMENFTHLLLYQLQIKKSLREQLLSRTNEQNSVEVSFLARNLIKTQKELFSLPNPQRLRLAVFQNLKNKLAEQGINQETIENLCNIQKEINELKKELRKECQEYQNQIEMELN